MLIDPSKLRLVKAKAKVKKQPSTKDVAFKRLCLDVADRMDVPVEFFEDTLIIDANCVDCFEDDGCLHVRMGKTRACFDVGNGQNRSAAQQNVETVKVLTGLGMEKKIEAHVMAQDEDPCPCCGCSCGGGF